MPKFNTETGVWEADIQDTAFTPAPTLQETKINTLSQAAERKREVLGYSQPGFTTEPSQIGILKSIYDADTYTMQGNDRSTRALGVNAYETSKPESWFNNPRNVARIEKQKAQLSRELGIDATTEDVFAAGAKQRDEARGILGVPGLPALVQSEQLTNISGENTPQNNYGRNLGAVQTLGGMMTLPDGTEVDARQSIGQVPQETDQVAAAKARLEANDYGDMTSGNRLENIGTGLKYGIGRKVAGIADSLVDASTRGVKELYKTAYDEDEKTASKRMYEDLTFTKDWFTPEMDFTGVDAYKEAKTYNYDDARTKKLMTDVADKWKGKDYTGLAGTILEGIATAGPEMFVESSGEMALGALGKLGLVFNTADYNNQILEEREKITGEVADGQGRLLAAAGAVGMSLVNKAGTDEMLGKTKVVQNAMNAVINSGSKDMSIAAVKKLAKVGVTTAGKGVYEGLEEVIQEGMQLVAEKYGTDVQDEIMSDKSVERLLQGFAGGLGAGTTIGGATAVGGEVSQIVKDKKRNILAENVRKTVGKEMNQAQTDLLDKYKAEGITDLSPEQKQAVQDLATPVVDETTSEEEIVSPEADMEAVSGIDEEVYATATKEEAADVVRDYTSRELEKGTDPEVVTKTAKEMINRMKALGVAEVITQADREAGLTLEVTDVTDVALKEKGKKKTETFDPIKVDDTAIDKISKGEFTSDVMSKIIGSVKDSKLIERLSTQMAKGHPVQQEIEKASTEVADTVNSEKGIKALDGIIDPNQSNKEAKAMRIASLVMDQVYSSIPAEYDINTNANLADREVSGARTMDMAEQLGKNYVNSYGLQYKGSAQQLAKKYAEIGQKMINFVAETGMINLSDEVVVAPRVVNKQGVAIMSEDALREQTGLKVVGNEITVDGAKNVPMIQTQVATLADNRGKGRDVKSKKGYALGRLAKLLKPTNYELPTTEPVEDVKVDRKIGEAHESIIKDYNALKYQVKPDMLKLLKEVKERIYGTDGQGDFDTALMNDPTIVNQLLGVQNTNSMLLKTSDQGKSLNRKDQLRKVLDNLEFLEDTDEMYFNYESAVNQRIHVLQTILDYQGDKYMSRQLLTGGDYTTKKGTQQAHALVEALADEMGISMEEVLDPKDKALVNAMKYLDKTNGILDLRNLMSMIKHLNLEHMSTFAAMSTIMGMYDVHKAKDKDVISSNYMVEFDATASGVVNTLLNLSGKEVVQKILSKMGIGKGEVTKSDPYMLLTNKVPELYGESYDTDIKPVLDRLAETGAKVFMLRDIAKGPVMTWFYGQKNTNTEDTMADDIAKNLVIEAIQSKNQVAVDIVNEILGTEYVIDAKDGVPKYINNITKAELNKLKAYYKEKIAIPYVDSLEKAFPGVKEYRQQMGELFKLLEKTGKWEGLLGTAMDKMLPEVDENGSPLTHKMSVRKKKRSISDSVGNAIQVPVNEMYNNQASLAVNPQHATDAALLLLALQKMMSLDPSGKGAMSVHDAVYGSPEQVLNVKAQYDKDTVAVAGEYDYVDTAIQEVKEAINKMTDEKLAKDVSDTLALITKDHNKELANKKAFLEGLSVNVFGSKTVSKEVVTPVKVVRTTKVKNISKFNDFQKKLSPVLKNIREGKNARKEVLELVKGMEVSERYKAQLAKVVKALEGGEITVKASTLYKAMPGEIYIDVKSANDKRTDKKFTADTLVETLGHEIDHAYQMQYIYDNMNSVEVKYLGNVVTAINKIDKTKLSDAARSRVEYILDQDSREVTGDIASKNSKNIQKALQEKKYAQIAELAAILGNEGPVADEILGALPNKSKISTMISKLLEAINNWINSMTQEERISKLTELKNDPVTAMATVLALKVMDDNARVQFAKSQTENTNLSALKMTQNTRQDTLSDAYINPYRYADGIIAKSNSLISAMMMVFGTSVYRLMEPIVKAGHEKAKGNTIYDGSLNLIRTGFYDSDIAQRMRDTIGINNDSKKVLLNKLQGLGTSMMQDSEKLLNASLSELDNRVNKIYTKDEDKVRIYQLFSRTGISGLQYHEPIYKGVMEGDMTIEEAIEIITPALSAEKRKRLDEVAKYYITGKTTNNYINVPSAIGHNVHGQVYVALKALQLVPDAKGMISGMDKTLKKDLYGMTLAIHALNNEVNHQGMDPLTGEYHAEHPTYSVDYDGHFNLDVHEDRYEFKAVSFADVKRSRYSETEDWKVVKAPTSETIGIMARPLLDASHTPGVGLNTNKFNNGFYLDQEQSALMNQKLKALYNKPNGAILVRDYLIDNSIVKDGTRFRFLLDEETKVKHLSMKQSVAHSLYRTYVHNKELIESQSIRDMVLNEGTLTVSTLDQLYKLEDTVRENRNKSGTDKEELYPFVTLNVPYESFDALPKWIKKYYKTPDNLSTYNGFNRKIHLVKRGQADVLIGHKNFSIFGSTEHRTLAKVENMYKKLVIMTKLHMVVTAPAKLGVDFISNLGILGTKDVSLVDTYTGFKEGWAEYKELSKLRGELALLQVEARMGKPGGLDKVNKKKEEIKKAKFYDAFKAGFVQSYSTDLILKEFDTISGLQKDIDTVIDAATYDKAGNPNDIHKAIKWWMKLGADKGFTVDGLMKGASELSILNGTSIAEEMSNLSARLKSKKDVESVARYVSDLIGSPSSEIVGIGGAVMVITDALSKYTLARSLLKRVDPKTGTKYTKDTAYQEANETFIDYRNNMPSEVKAMSDYAILMFPAFWIKIQKVIAGLATYHPATAIGGYAIADALDIGGANIIDVNIINKIGEDSVVGDGVNIIGWSTFSPLL